MTSEAVETDAGERPPFSVYPGTPLGERLRRHWVPVLPVDVLHRQHARRVKVLGEDLVCYRDRVGRHGLIGDHCPHRGVSLEWGVAADVGLRCPYHGWCFDQTGQCVDIPLEGLITRDYVHITAYPVHEHGGVLWAYLGEGEPPAFPDLGALGDDSVLRHLRFTVVGRNWLDLLEGVAAAGGVAATRSPFALLVGDELEAMLSPLDDMRTLLISGDCLGYVPAGLAAAHPATDLCGAESSGNHPGRLQAPGPLASAHLAKSVDPGFSRLSAGGAARAADAVEFFTLAALDRGPLADLTAILGARDAAGDGPLHSPRAEGLRVLPSAGDWAYCALDLLVRTQLPLWLDALQSTAPAAALRQLPALSAASDLSSHQVLLALAQKVALEAFENALTETLREPWKLVWPYVWNAESSARWAKGRDRAGAAAWRTDWQTASEALHRGGTVELARAAFAVGGDHAALATRALAATELAARACCWSAAWKWTWAEIVAEIRETEVEVPDVRRPAAIAATTATAVAVATRVALRDGVASVPQTPDERCGAAGLTSDPREDGECQSRR